MPQERHLVIGIDYFLNQIENSWMRNDALLDNTTNTTPSHIINFFKEGVHAHSFQECNQPTVPLLYNVINLIVRKHQFCYCCTMTVSTDTPFNLHIKVISTI